MTRNQSLAFRTMLFLFGAGVVAFAFVLNTSGKVLTNTAMFTWISIGIMYLIFFIPVFFSTIAIANFSGKIPSLSIMWTGIIGYIIASIIVILLLSNAGISLRKALAGQSALLFLFAVCVFLAFFASSHARQVDEEEKKKRQFGLKARAQLLSPSINSLPSEYEAVKTTIARALEEIKYLSPVDRFEGFDLELKIMYSLDALSDVCDAIAADEQAVHMEMSVSLEKEARMLQMLVKERKLLRN
ncbi:MAG: hypothetical protein LBF60_09420 [Treponema sp.]|nr:hypothetical protein [Treponema sp.]